MLTKFDENVHQIIENLSNPYSDLTDDDFCMQLRGPGAVQQRRRHALTIISRELHRVYDKHVIVLIDECDSPILSAIQHGYAAEVCFFNIFLHCGLPHVILGQHFFFCSIWFIVGGLSTPVPEMSLIDLF
jgi:hypothetical protein